MKAARGIIPATPSGAVAGPSGAAVGLSGAAPQEVEPAINRYMLAEARSYRNACFPRGGKGDADPDSLRYAQTPTFDLRLVAGWIAGEWEHLAECYKLRCDEAEYPEPNEFVNFVAAIKTGTIEPILIIQAEDLNYYIWDGNHRAGTAFAHGIFMVPAYVGYQVRSSATCRYCGDPVHTGECC